MEVTNRAGLSGGCDHGIEGTADATGMLPTTKQLVDLFPIQTVGVPTPIHVLNL
jgi:hypothetical protein